MGGAGSNSQTHIDDGDSDDNPALSSSHPAARAHPARSGHRWRGQQARLVRRLGEGASARLVQRPTAP